MRVFGKTIDLREAVTYTLSSLLATALDYAVYLLVLFFLHKYNIVTGWDIVVFGICIFKLNDINIAYTAARIVSSVENFYFNNYLVFKKRGEGRVMVRMGKYMLVALVVAVLGNLCITLFHVVCRINALIAKVITDVSIFIVSYYGQKLYVFKEKKRPAAAEINTENADNRR